MVYSPSYISGGSGFGRCARRVSELSLRWVLNAMDVASRHWKLILSTRFQPSVIRDVYFALRFNRGHICSCVFHSSV